MFLRVIDEYGLRKALWGAEVLKWYNWNSVENSIIHYVYKLLGMGPNTWIFEYSKIGQIIE